MDAQLISGAEKEEAMIFGKMFHVHTSDEVYGEERWGDGACYYS